jgi:PTS system ascorbate-specific IIC component
LCPLSKHHYIYLTGHMIWVQAGAFACWSIPLGRNACGCGAGFHCRWFYLTLAPALRSLFMRLITGSDEIAFCHGQTLLNMLGEWAGKLVGNRKIPTRN